MIRVGLAAALCVAMGLLVGCQRAAIAVGQARLTSTGRVLVAAPGQAYHPATSHRVHDGDRIKVVDGHATLTRHDGGSLELRPGTELRFATAPVLLTGQVLAVSGSAPFDIQSAGTTLTVTGGAARILRDLAVTVGTYRGTVTIDSAGRTLSVPALRQATAVGLGVLPARPSPLSYRDDDLWDRRYLGIAIELADQLQARSDGFSSALSPGAGQSAGFYRVLLPSLAAQPQFVPALVDGRHSPGETLVGATLAETGHRGSFAQRWNQVFSFRDDGATWGLVAMDQAVTDVVKVTGSIDAALGRSLVFANPTTVPVAAAVTAPASPAVTSVSPVSPSKVPSPTTTVPGTKLPTPQLPQPLLPTPQLPTPTTGTPLDGILDPLTATVNQLLGVLN